MKYIKRVATTFLNKIQGAIINSFNASVDETVNAPSIKVVKEHSVKVSPTQPTTGEKVWIQEGENIFNPETDIEFTDRFRECESGTIASSAYHCGVKIKVNPNTTYVTNSNIPIGEWSNLCFFDTDMNFISGDAYNTENKVFTTPNNCAYVTMAVLKTYTYFQLKENIKNIYIRNDNGIYEEFYNNSKIQIYSTEEQVIGVWIDGKLLYRKVIEFPNGVGTTSTYKKSLADLGITNIAHIHIGTPSYYTYSNQHYPFSNYDGSNRYEVNVNPTDLRIICGNTDIANNEILITLEYTKTIA